MELIDVSKLSQPAFRDRSTLSVEQLTDPDHALKELERFFNQGKYLIGCSKCHHCR